MWKKRGHFPLERAQINKMMQEKRGHLPRALPNQIPITTTRNRRNPMKKRLSTLKLTPRTYLKPADLIHLSQSTHQPNLRHSVRRARKLTRQNREFKMMDQI